MPLQFALLDRCHEVFVWSDGLLDRVEDLFLDQWRTYCCTSLLLLLLVLPINDKFKKRWIGPAESWTGRRTRSCVIGSRRGSGERHDEGMENLLYIAAATATS